MTDDRTPVIVGVAQETLRDQDPTESLEPGAWLERVARAACADAGAAQRVLAEIDVLGLVPVLGWHAVNPPGALAARLSAKPAETAMLAVGGEMPLRFVAHAAAEIAAGRARSVLLCGAHAVRTLRRARHRGVVLDWRDATPGAPGSFGESLPGTRDEEIRHGLDRPSTIYPVFENALRARRGASLPAHQQRLGRLMAPFTRVAARNPHAWFPTQRDAETLVRPTPGNRMVAYPYTKYLNAVIETDQAAAIWMLSAGAARRYGIPASRQVHLVGAGDAVERAWFPSERPDLSRCPAMAAAAHAALSRAGLAVSDLDAFDLYSCFPVAVALGCEGLGIAEDDPRGLTVTGGLPYAGGPGNGYTLHALAALVEQLRARPGRGLVTGNGWYLTKHAALVLASEPVRRGREPEPFEGPAPIPVRAETDGPAVIDGWTVVHARDGAPQRGIVVGRTPAGERFVANTPDDPAFLEAFESAEQVGRSGRVRVRDGHNLFEA